MKNKYFLSLNIAVLVFLLLVLFKVDFVKAEEIEVIADQPVSIEMVGVEVENENGSGAVVTSENGDQNAVITTTEPVEEVVDDTLKNMTVNVPNKVPSGFGLFWRGIKERVSIALTINPLKKAEKQLQFAEERMKIAEIIAEKSADPKIQAWAEKSMEKANELMKKVEAKKEKWINSPKSEARQLMENIAIHQIRRERIMDKLEEKLPAEKVEKFRELREDALNGGRRLLNAINNEKVPENVREKLQAVKTRIEEHATEVKEFREEKKDLLEKAKTGDEQAKTDLKELQAERQETIKNRLESYKEKRVELKEQAENGVRPAEKKLEKIENRQEIRKEIKSEIKEKMQEVRQERQEIRNNRILENKEETNSEPLTR